MSRLVSRAEIIAAIILKDIRIFTHDRLWIVLTPFSVIFVTVAFWIAPEKVVDTIHVGIYPAESTSLMAKLVKDNESDDGVVLVSFADEQRMMAAIAGDLQEPSEKEDKVSMGLAFPSGFAENIKAGVQSTVTLYLDASIPAELKNALAGEVREAAYGLRAVLAGQDPNQALPVTLMDEKETILGEDLTGAQVPMRDKLRPVLALLILMLGSVAIAGLVAVEIEQRTAVAILVTPASPGDLLTAKAITGTMLGASQALLFLLLTWSFGPHWWMVVALMLLGAAMMAALGMIAGSAGRDFMSTMFLSVALIIPLVIPAVAAFFPGSTSLWVAAMPSCGLTDGLVGLFGYNRSPVQMIRPIILSLAWTTVLFLIALLLLKRRIETL